MTHAAKLLYEYVQTKRRSFCISYSITTDLTHLVKTRRAHTQSTHAEHPKRFCSTHAGSQSVELRVGMVSSAARRMTTVQQITTASPLLLVQRVLQEGQR
jgi:hypothetical protein